MDIYVNTSEGERLRRAAVEPGTKIAQLAVLHGGAGAVVFRENDEEPLDPDATVEDAGLEDGNRVYVGKCKRIEVTVNYGEDDKEKSFPPSASIASVREWAMGPKGFTLPEAERIKHTLAVCDSEDQPDGSDHVGSYADGECKACFDLVPKERHEG